MAIAAMQPLEMTLNIRIEVPLIIDESKPEECADAAIALVKEKMAIKLEELAEEVKLSFGMMGFKDVY